MEPRRRPFSLAIVLLGLGVVLFATGAKLALINRYGTDQPYADQWMAEGMYFLRGPLYYQVDFSQIISLHGEHRPGLTRLWTRGLILANEGQWDCFVELVANLLIYGAFLAIFWWWLASLVEGLWLAAVAVVMAVLFALPCAHENFLWGFQSCFLFMLLAGLLHVTGTLESTRPTGRWCLAQLAGLVGLFSIAAGAMSAAALAVLAGIELLRGRRNAWVWSTLVANTVLLGLGLWLLPDTSATRSDHFGRLGQAVAGTGYLLSWPYAGLWWSLLLQAPCVISLVASWRSSDEERAAADRKVGTIWMWIAGVAFSIAYGRAVTSTSIGVRYFDVLLFGLFVNFLALVRLGGRRARSRRMLWHGLASTWLLIVVVGLWGKNKPEDLGPTFKYQHDLAVEQRQLVRDFLISSDSTKLEEFEKTSHRFPHFRITLDFLRDPKVPALLPPSLTPDGHANRLSRLARRVATIWPLLLGAGVIFLALGAFRLIRGRSEVSYI